MMEGDGGTPPVPAGYVPPSLPGVAVGPFSGIFRGRLVIVSSTGPNTGVFVYSGTPATGNPPIFWATSASTDPFNNAIPSTAGVAGTGIFRAGNTIINPNGVFTYAGTPAAGNLVFASAPAGGTDPYGNVYVAGAAFYNVISGSNYYATVGASGGTTPRLFFQNQTSPANFVPFVAATVAAAGCQLVLDSGAGTLAAIDASIQIRDSLMDGGTYPNGRINIIATELDLPQSGGPFIAGESFHTIGLPSTGGFTGAIRVKKLPWNMIALDFGLQWTNTTGGTFTCGSLPDATYYPTTATPRRFALGTGGTPTGDAQAGLIVPASGALSVFVNASTAGNTAQFSGGTYTYPTN